MVSIENNNKKKSKKSKKIKTISFDEETVTKEHAEKLLGDQQKVENKKDNKPKQKNGNKPVKGQQSRGQKKNKQKDGASTDVNSSIKEQSESTSQEKKPPKRKKNKQNPNVDAVPQKKQKTEEKHETDEGEGEDEDEEEILDTDGKTTIEKPESIRAMKRRKHENLLKEKKLKHELDMQQKSLNYLSKWKHSRTEWKFEKLRQIWLQQNMYDTAKVPDQFWGTLVEYLSGSKGQIRKVLIKEALGVIEKKEAKKNEEENNDAEEESEEKIDDANIIKRARDVIQNLEE